MINKYDKQTINSKNITCPYCNYEYKKSNNFIEGMVNDEESYLECLN